MNMLWNKILLGNFCSLFIFAILVGAKGYTDSDCYKDGVHLTGPVAIEGECESYLLCSNSAAPIQMPCPDGLAFDPIQSVCTWPRDVAACYDMNGVDAPAYYCYDENGVFVDRAPFLKPGTCNTYYECSYRQLTEQKCPGDLVFKETSTLCDYPSDPPDCFPSTTIFPDYNQKPHATISPEQQTDDPLKETTTTGLNHITSTPRLESSTIATTPLLTTIPPSTTALTPDSTPAVETSTSNPITTPPSTTVVTHSSTPVETTTSNPITTPPSTTVVTHSSTPAVETTTSNPITTPPSTTVVTHSSTPVETTTSNPITIPPSTTVVTHSTTPAVETTTSNPITTPPSTTVVTHSSTPVETTTSNPITTPPSTTVVTHSSTPVETTTSNPITIPPSTTVRTTLQPPAPTYIGIVVDTTSSMTNEIVAVKEWLTNCVEGDYDYNMPSGGWVLTTFNDPYLGEVIGPTTNIADIISAIDDLFAHGGGDCPEYSMSGIKNAASVIPNVNGGCKMFLFTDATAKDGALLSRTMKIFEKNGCSFIPVLTGCCHDCEDPCISQSLEYCTNFVTDERSQSLFNKRRSLDSQSTPGERMYYDLASESSGTIYLTDKPSNPEEMLDFLEEHVTLGFCPSTEIAGPPPFGYANEYECDISGSCWDRNVGKCYCQSTTEYCPKDPIFPDCTMEAVDVLMPDPADRNMYYECASGNVLRHACAPGNVFDPTIGSCTDLHLTRTPSGTWNDIN